MDNEENKRAEYLREVARYFNTEDSLIEYLFSAGMLDMPLGADEGFLDSHDFEIIRRAARLHRDLGVNAEGVDVILHMHEQLRQLKQEIDTLRRFYSQFDREGDLPFIDAEE
jgi:predicted methyltransferase MtxX (methanogen marker protein 4)